MKETIIFEYYGDWIRMGVTQTIPDGPSKVFVYDSENKAKHFGSYLLEDIERCMDLELCNRVKITIDIEPIKED